MRTTTPIAPTQAQRERAAGTARLFAWSGFTPWTKKGATNAETDLVLAQKQRPRNPGKEVTGPL